MRYVASLALVLVLLVGASLVNDSPVFTSSDQPPTAAIATVGTWVNIGPAPLSYAHNPADPRNFNSGRVATIAVDPSNAYHWLIGVGNGGVWESMDGGTSWLPIADSAPTLAIGSIAFAPSNPRIIYVGTGESAGVGFTRTGVGVLKSTDSGRTWAVLGAANFARAAVRRMRVHPTNANVAIAATTRAGFGRDSLENVPASPLFGIQKSVDGGVTWTRTLTGQATALEIDPTEFNRQYAAIGDQRGDLSHEQPGSVINGLYRSINGGDSWARVDGPWGAGTVPDAVGRIELAISPSAPNVLYASMQNPVFAAGGPNALYGLFRTDNAWAPVPTWVRVPTDAAGDRGYCGPGKCGYSHVISVDPSNPNTLYAGGAERGFWRCTNCGATPTWTNTTANSNVHPDHHALAWAGNRLIDGNDGGVWSTSNGGVTWENHNSGLSTAMFFSAALHPTDRDFMVGGIRDFAASVAGPNNRWSILTFVTPTWEWGEADVVMSSTAPATHWMLAWLRGAIQRTTDGGTTGIQADAGINKTGAAFVAPVRKCPVNDDVFLTGTNRMWRSNNFFSAASPSWTANGPPHPFPFPDWIEAPGTIHAIAFASSEGGCNTYAYGNRGGEIYLTRDGGATWTDLDPTTMLPARPINSIVFDPTSASIAYAALSSFNDGTPGQPGHVFKSTNALSATPTWIGHQPCRRRAIQRARDRPAQSQSGVRGQRQRLVADHGRRDDVEQAGVGGRHPERAGPRHSDQSHDRQHHRVHLRSRRVSAGDSSHHGAPSLEPAGAIGSRQHRDRVVHPSRRWSDADGIRPRRRHHARAGAGGAADCRGHIHAHVPGTDRSVLHSRARTLRRLAQRGLERSAVVRERLGGARRRGESVVAGRWQHRLTRVDAQREWRGLNRAPHRRSRRVEHVGAHPRDREHHGQQRTAGAV